MDVEDVVDVVDVVDIVDMDMELGYLELELNMDIGGFQSEFVSIRWVINHMTCYKSKCSHHLKLQHSDWRSNLVKDFFHQ